MSVPSHSLRIETHLVPPLDQKKRLQEYAVGIFRTINSRAGIKKVIKKGLILVNSEKGYTGDWITGGETIELYEPANTKKPILDLSLEVVYEDEYLAIISKPAGVLVSGNKRFTIENALPYNLKRSKQADALKRPEPIHRLDYPTTGALLVGKTVSVVTQLNKLFEERAINKIYHAVAIGTIKDTGVITEAIDEKECKSEFKKLFTIASERFECLNLLELKPHTGRRHQLRRHLSGIGNPILGDALYGTEELLLKGNGLYLHASSLQFTHPITTKDVAVVVPLPKKFMRLFPSY